MLARSGEDPTPPAVSCAPAGPGCDQVGRGSGGATGVIGLTTVDSAKITPDAQPFPDIEPPDQSLCAGNGYIVEANNVGEILIFNTRLQRLSQVIPLDTLMGLTSRGWSSGGDISCLYDASNGGHWFFTEFVSTNSESSGGAFTGCFNAVANACREGLAVTRGNNPFGPYNVYFVNPNYNPAEPGYPYLLNDFAKIATTRDAFLLFYDEFPQSASAPGFGGGGFNGAQQFAFDKTALERGWPVTKRAARPMRASPSRSRTWACWRPQTGPVPRRPASRAGTRRSRRRRRTRASGTTVTAAPGSCWTRWTTTGWAIPESRSSTGPG